MLSEILKVIPRLSQSDLNAMQKQLQGRFTKVAKGFGKGLMNVIKGGGVLGVITAVLDKILNPLKDVQESIDRVLQSSADVSTQATQFNTSTGKLFKLLQLAKAKGLDQDGLFQLMTKFQTAVANARVNPNDESTSAVRNFVGEEDTAEGFFGFIRSLQHMDKNTQLLVQQQVFGEKQILKMADFLQADFEKLASAIGIDKVSAERYGNSIEKLNNLDNLAKNLQIRRETGDVLTKSRIINEGMIRTREASEQMALDKENKRIQSYQDLATLSQTSEKIMGLLETGLTMLGKLINVLTPVVVKLGTTLEKFAASPMMRGVRGLFGGGKDD